MGTILSFLVILFAIYIFVGCLLLGFSVHMENLDGTEPSYFDFLIFIFFWPFIFKG